MIAQVFQIRSTPVVRRISNPEEIDQPCIRGKTLPKESKGPVQYAESFRRVFEDQGDNPRGHALHDDQTY